MDGPRSLSVCLAYSYSLTQVGSYVGARLIIEEFPDWVEAASGLHTAAGVAVAYDALLLAVGTHQGGLSPMS